MARPPTSKIAAPPLISRSFTPSGVTSPGRTLRMVRPSMITCTSFAPIAVT